MPKRKRKGGGLGCKRKGYWKAFQSMQKKDENNDSNNDGDQNITLISAVDVQVENDQESENQLTILDTNENTNEVSNFSDVNDDDCTDNSDDEFPNIDQRIQEKYFARQFTKVRRWGIFGLFVFKYKGLSPPDGDFYKFWSGRGGIASKIKKDLEIPRNSGTKLIQLFEFILECHRNESDFDPRAFETRGGQRPLLISIDSPEAQIVADGIESGLSIRKTWHNLNRHRQECNLELLSESTVISAFRRMKPKIRRIKKRKQGSRDPDSTWSRARYEWVTQLLVRLGELDDEEIPRPLERRFSRDHVGHLHLHQVVWWDETHRKCLIGGLSCTKNYQILFPRDSSGKLCLSGKYSKKKCQFST